jgi:hypothetical protein
MKSITILTTFVAATLAAPLLDLFSVLKCPANSAQRDGSLPKGYITTSLLLPISAKNPNKVYAASQWAQITPNDMCTVFNLELSADATQGKICNLVFDFPSLLQGPPGIFQHLGLGTMHFTGYAIGAGATAGKTTYSKQPAAGPSPATPPPKMLPGNSYVVNSGPCGIPAGAGTVTVSGSLCSPDTIFSFQQGVGSCPMGFYVVLTDA